MSNSMQYFTAIMILSSVHALRVDTVAGLVENSNGVPTIDGTTTSKLGAISTDSVTPEVEHGDSRTSDVSRIPVEPTEASLYSQLLNIFMNSGSSPSPGLALSSQLRGSLFNSDLYQAPPGLHLNSALLKLLHWPGLSTFVQQLENSTEMASLQNAMMGNGLNENGLNSVVNVVEGLMSNLQTVLSPEALSSENQCKADFSRYIHGVMKGEMWALKMLDASGKPGTSILEGALMFLGNYDECLSVSHKVTNGNTKSDHVIKGSYCQFFFSLPPSVANLTDAKLPISLGPPSLQWNLCLPKSCNDTQLVKGASALPFKNIGLSLVNAKTEKQKDWKKDNVTIATIVVFSVVVCLSVIGTLYDVISTELQNRGNEENEVEKQVSGGIELTSVRENGTKISNGTVETEIGNVVIYQGKPNQPKQQTSTGFGRQLLLSFSLSKNTEKILNTSTGDSNLGCIHGIRVLSMAWVILGHSISWDSMNAVSNKAEYGAWIKRFTFQFLLNGTLSVDTFFVLSGCLVTYLFLKECEKSRKGKPTIAQMVLYYVHRWWRLTPMYMLVILFYTGLLDYIIDGPLVGGKFLFHGDHCRTKWWTNILYINNFSKITEMCFPVSWFLAIDMQLYVIAPIVLLPLGFGIYWVGYTGLFLLLATHISTYGYFEWSTGGSTELVNSDAEMDQIYLKPWCRVGTFAIGMILGTILYKTRCKTRLSRIGLLVGWQAFLAIGLLSVYITFDEFREGGTMWSMNERIIHETLSRPGWALFVSWVIFVCCTGHGGFVNSILSWSAWIPLGRLTYGAYLTHPVLLSYTDFSLRTLVYNDIPRLSYHFIGTFTMAYATSFLLSVFMESPCMGLEKAVLKKLRMKK